MFHAKIKHVEVHYHFIREKVRKEEIVMQQIKNGIIASKAKNYIQYRILGKLPSLEYPIMNVVTSSTNSRQCTWEVLGFDDCSTTLLNRGNKRSIQPFIIRNKLIDRFLLPRDNSVAWLTFGYFVVEWLPEMMNQFSILRPFDPEKDLKQLSPISRSWKWMTTTSKKETSKSKNKK